MIHWHDNVFSRFLLIYFYLHTHAHIYQRSVSLSLKGFVKARMRQAEQNDLRCEKTCIKFCIRENKGVDQLHSKCAADQRLCFRYINSTIPLLPKSEISNLKPSSVAVQPGLYSAWLETPKTVFLIMQLKSCQSSFIWVT